VISIEVEMFGRSCRRDHIGPEEAVSASTLPLSFTSHLKSKFLEGLAPSELRIIFAAAIERRFLANTVVVRQGESADHFFLLTKGRARLFYVTEDGAKNLLVWLTPGKVFGGDALICKPSRYLVSTEVLKESCALVWDRATIQGLAAMYPRLMQNAFLLASEYLGWHMVEREALTCHTGRQRLAHLLTSLARVIGEKVPGGIELDATNEELASASNISRFLVSRLLSEWKREHVVEKRRGKILLRSLERLKGPGKINGPSSQRR
jgi:CRP/FNR family transcriptional regulator, nitrogen oxide reductase regulator